MQELNSKLQERQQLKIAFLDFWMVCLVSATKSALRIASDVLCIYNFALCCTGAKFMNCSVSLNIQALEIDLSLE